MRTAVVHICIISLSPVAVMAFARTHAPCPEWNEYALYIPTPLVRGWVNGACLLLVGIALSIGAHCDAWRACGLRMGYSEAH